MERPNTVLGLTARVARDRWQRLSTGGRILLVAGGALVSLGCLAGVHMAIGGASCASSAPASLHAEAAPPGAGSDCPCAH